ncbi:MAG: hypothetical protein KatS3mg057_2893 [Herpetosiphonaceae bacterium]|nr:MAG: hypothetical protein KatS3mg057_2893 [Herpetosiphonaceae bacterium]
MNESVANERKPSSEDAAEKPYRILLPLSRAQHFPSMLRLAAALTRARRGELVILHVIVPDQPGVEARNLCYRRKSVKLLEGVPYEVVTIHTENSSRGHFGDGEQASLQSDLARLARSPAWPAQQARARSLTPWCRMPPCDVILFKSDPGAADALSAPRILLVMEDRHHTVRACRSGAGAGALYRRKRQLYLGCA